MHIILYNSVGSWDRGILCDRINDFFVNLTREFVPLTPDDVAGIAVESVPTELLTTPWEAEKALRGIKIKKAPGPDGLPNVVLKEFAYELGPVISDMYNASLRQGFLPPLLKSAVVRPLPKQKPAMSVEKDIRPVSLTCQVAKVMESFTLVRFLPVLLDKLDLKQFALSGRSTSQALVYLLHLDPALHVPRARLNISLSVPLFSLDDIL